MVEIALFPPQFPDVETVLLALDDIYHRNHEGQVGHYRVTRAADDRVHVACETPYPADFERGLIEGIARNTALCRGRRYDVAFHESERGATRTCTLAVSRL